MVQPHLGMFSIALFCVPDNVKHSFLSISFYRCVLYSIVRLFLSLQVFHFTMLSSELYRVYKRMGGLKYRLLSWFFWFLKFWFFSVRGSSRVGFHTSFGDGSDIPEGHLEHVRDVVWKNMVFNHWKQGDVVMIDNFRISHGRQVTTDTRYIFSSSHSALFTFPPIIMNEGPIVLDYDRSLPLSTAILGSEKDRGVMVPALHQAQSPFHSSWNSLTLAQFRSLWQRTLIIIVRETVGAESKRCIHTVNTMTVALMKLNKIVSVRFLT